MVCGKNPIKKSYEELCGKKQAGSYKGHYHAFHGDMSTFRLYPENSFIMFSVAFRDGRSRALPAVVIDFRERLLRG